MNESMHWDYTGRNVFVAGGSSGINLGLATAFGRCGAQVTIASRSAERVQQAVQGLQAQGIRAWGHSADVRDPLAIGAALEQAAASMGPIDVLISGAAGNFIAPALGMSSNGFKTVVDIDLNGTFNVLRQAHQHLRKPGACVINISAPQAYNPVMYQAHVCAAKAGVDMLTRVLAMEWGADGVRVNSIVPGPIADTEGIRRLAPTPKAVQAMEQSVPLGRMGSTQDVADLALFLASAQASYITGTIIAVDGGSSLQGGRKLTYTG